MIVATEDDKSGVSLTALLFQKKTEQKNLYFDAHYTVQLYSFWNHIINPRVEFYVISVLFCANIKI